MLKLNPVFDTQKDVVSSILAKEERTNIGKWIQCTCNNIMYLFNNISSSSSSGSSNYINPTVFLLVLLIRRRGHAVIVYISVYTSHELIYLFIMCAGVLEPRILSVERDGGVVYSWRVSLTLVSCVTLI